MQFCDYVTDRVPAHLQLGTLSALKRIKTVVGALKE